MLFVFVYIKQFQLILYTIFSKYRIRDNDLLISFQSIAASDYNE